MVPVVFLIMILILLSSICSLCTTIGCFVTRLRRATKCLAVLIWLCYYLLGWSLIMPVVLMTKAIIGSSSLGNDRVNLGRSPYCGRLIRLI